jgi:hypothetical protein
MTTLNDTTATVWNNDFAKVVTVRGCFQGVITIPYNVAREQQRRDNLIANRELPPVRTDYSTEDW